MIYNLYQNDRLLFTYVGKPSTKQLKKFFSDEYASYLYKYGELMIEQNLQYVKYTLKLTAFEVGDEYDDNYITKLDKLNKFLRGKINV